MTVACAPSSAHPRRARAAALIEAQRRHRRAATRWRSTVHDLRISRWRSHRSVRIAGARRSPDCNAVRGCLHSAQVPVKDEQRSHRTSTATRWPHQGRFKERITRRDPVRWHHSRAAPGVVELNSSSHPGTLPWPSQGGENENSAVQKIHFILSPSKIVCGKVAARERRPRGPSQTRPQCFWRPACHTLFEEDCIPHDTSRTTSHQRRRQ